MISGVFVSKEVRRMKVGRKKYGWKKVSLCVWERHENARGVKTVQQQCCVSFLSKHGEKMLRESELAAKRHYHPL